MDCSNADSVVKDPKDHLQYFVKPLEVIEPFSCFLKDIIAQEQGGDSGLNVKYAQTRMSVTAQQHQTRALRFTENDNLRGEYEKLFQDVEPDVTWARIALGYRPEAINLWLGNSRSITSLHKDNYENIYCQIVGRKHFVLLPPVEAACINEKLLPVARYVVSNFKAG